MWVRVKIAKVVLGFHRRNLAGSMLGRIGLEVTLATGQ